MVKTRSQKIEEKKKKETLNENDIDKIADSLVDKPYGQSKAKHESIVYEGQSVSFPTPMLRMLEDLALNNKRRRLENRTVSAIVQAAVAEYFVNHNIKNSNY